MKIIFIGDIVGEPGRDAVKQIMPKLRSQADIVVANAENLCHGRGVNESTLQEMQLAGISFFTGGDHIFWQKDTETIIDRFPIVRPANYPEPCSGVGYRLFEISGQSKKLLLINLLGRTSFGGPWCYLDDPFRTLDLILNNYPDKENIISLVDFHAEATSEKYAFAFYFDGRVDAIVGTHTHVPTCDNRVLPKGTMYVSDVGMTGNIDSVLGVKTEIIQNVFLTAQNQRFEWETTGKKAFRGVIIDSDNKTIERMDFVL